MARLSNGTTTSPPPDVAMAAMPVGVLTALVAQHGAPRNLRSDNGAEFVALVLQGWLVQRKVSIALIQIVLDNSGTNPSATALAGTGQG